MAHNMTVTVEDSLWKEMKEHKEIRWSAVMKEAARERLRALKALDTLSKKSKLSEKDIRDVSVALGKEIKKKR